LGVSAAQLGGVGIPSTNLKHGENLKIRGENLSSHLKNSGINHASLFAIIKLGVLLLQLSHRRLGGTRFHWSFRSVCPQLRAGVPIRIRLSDEPVINLNGQIGSLTINQLITDMVEAKEEGRALGLDLCS